MLIGLFLILFAALAAADKDNNKGGQAAISSSTATTTTQASSTGFSSISGSNQNQQSSVGGIGSTSTTVSATISTSPTKTKTTSKPKKPKKFNVKINNSDNTTLSVNGSSFKVFLDDSTISINGSIGILKPLNMSKFKIQFNYKFPIPCAPPSNKTCQKKEKKEFSACAFSIPKYEKITDLTKVLSETLTSCAIPVQMIQISTTLKPLEDLGLPYCKNKKCVFKMNFMNDTNNALFRATTVLNGKKRKGKKKAGKKGGKS